ncbi:MAG: DUF971 family protein [Alphaproteobacteria bacterium]|jgi:DUF971 family protein
MQQPMEIRLRSDKKNLSIAFSAGEIYEYSAELLRVESPSAEVKGHAPHEKKIVAGKKDITIKAIEPVGHYAVKIIFSDGHQTGLYTWSYLQELGTEKDQLWAEYLENIEKMNLKREL